MSEYTPEEAAMDTERDYYDGVSKSDHEFAPYVKHIMNRYWNDSIVSWDECKESLSLVMNKDFPDSNKISYLVSYHEFKERK